MAEAPTTTWRSNFVMPGLLLVIMAACATAVNNGQMLVRLNTADERMQGDIDKIETSIKEIQVKTGNRFTRDKGDKYLEIINTLKTRVSLIEQRQQKD